MFFFNATISETKGSQQCLNSETIFKYDFFLIYHMKHFDFFFSDLKISHIKKPGGSQAGAQKYKLKSFKPTVPY